MAAWSDDSIADVSAAVVSAGTQRHVAPSFRPQVAGVNAEGDSLSVPRSVTAKRRRYPLISRARRVRLLGQSRTRLRQLRSIGSCTLSSKYSCPWANGRPIHDSKQGWIEGG
jgi:hypothetical protein